MWGEISLIAGLPGKSGYSPAEWLIWTANKIDVNHSFHCMQSFLKLLRCGTKNYISYTTDLEWCRGTGFVPFPPPHIGLLLYFSWFLSFYSHIIYFFREIKKAVKSDIIEQTSGGIRKMMYL